MIAHRARASRRRPWFEGLEDRAVPASLGIPWSDPGHITISFVPDGTPIAGHASTLFETLAPHPTTAWQGEILRAFQTWAANAGISVSVVPDDGEPLGTPGQTQHDPRFGDIRVGAQAMSPDALAISIPNDPSMTGTWTGDVLLNSGDVFDAQHLDLFAVVLHEAGHTFGLGESVDPSSSMYANYVHNTTLTSGDIKDIQALYGSRPSDLHEGSSGNETPAKAAQFPIPGGYDGTTPLAVFGDVGSNKDVDFYALRPPLSNYAGGATIRLQTAGVSLLAPRLTVLDVKGNVLGDAQSSVRSGDVVTIHLAKVSPNTTYYLEARGAAGDVFGIGHYGLSVTFDGTLKTPATAIDSVLRGDYQSLGPNDVNALFLDPSHVLFNNDHHSDDSTLSATVLTPVSGFARDSHYETLGSISDATDVDNYRIKVANPVAGQTNVLTIKARAIAPNGAAPNVTVLSSEGNLLPTTILANGGGLYTIQIAGLKAGGNLILRVSGAGHPAMTGNYGIEADFGGVAAAPTDFAKGLVSARSPSVSAPMYVARTQLFQFLLKADAPAAPAGAGVRMTVVDASGRTVFDLSAMAGETVSGPSVLLTPGSYTIRYTVLTSRGQAVPTLSFQLSGDVMSDPIGPTIKDPTLKPIFTTPGLPPKSAPTYTYPTGVVTPVPYWIGAPV